MSKRSSDLTLKILIGLLISLSIMLVSEGILLAVLFRKINMPKYSYSQEEYSTVLNKLNNELEPIDPQRTNQEYKKLIEQELGMRFYIYREKDTGKEYDGFAKVLIRTIIIKEGLTGYDYCVTFAHEVMHFKKYANQENYISFETFKYLYDNQDSEMHNFGVKYAIVQLQGLYTAEYDCRQQIIKYILGKEGGK